MLGGNSDSPWQYILCILILFLFVVSIKGFPHLYVFVLVWWGGSVMYALILNHITLSVDANPWTLSIVTTNAILLVPFLIGYSTDLHETTSTSTNKVIGFCNMLNIWSVVLGNLLIGGSITYYLKLTEPLVVLIVEILVHGWKSITSKHAKNGIISISLLIIFYMIAHYLTPGNSKTNPLPFGLVIGVISIVSVAIKVVLGAKHGEDPSFDSGYSLFLYRSVVGFKWLIGFSILAVIADPNVLYNLISLPAFILIIISQNLYNYASVEVNVKNLAGVYVNGKIIKRVIVLMALTLSARQSIDMQTRIIVETQNNGSVVDVAHRNGSVVKVAHNQENERIILFGAIGRHNFGDLLMVEVFESNLKDFCDISGYDVFFADILPRNMTIYGGREVAGITSFMNSTVKTNVVHVGGETSSCSIPCALRMIRPNKDLSELKTLQWISFQNKSPLAYIVSKSFFRNAGSFVTNTIGGSSQQANIILAGFDFASSRDFPSTEHRIFAPDSVITIKENFEDKIKANKPAYTNYVAVQFRQSENVELITEQLVMIVENLHCGVVFFRAGAAQGHDLLAPYQKIQNEMIDRGFRSNIHIFEGLDIWDISSLIAHSELVIATSLHVRIIAFAFSIPRTTFSPTQKHNSMINHWDFGALNCTIGATDTSHIYETAIATLNCSAFQNEDYSLRATQMYKTVFKTMIATMEICDSLA